MKAKHLWGRFTLIQDLLLMHSTPTIMRATKNSKCQVRPKNWEIAWKNRVKTILTLSSVPKLLMANKAKKTPVNCFKPHSRASRRQFVSTMYTGPPTTDTFLSGRSEGGDLDPKLDHCDRKGPHSPKDSRKLLDRREGAQKWRAKLVAYLISLPKYWGEGPSPLSRGRGE